METINVSVIICTYRRLGGLLQALKSMQEQTRATFEILVIDNADDQATEAAVREFNQHARIPATYIPFALGGLAGARNHGALQASGGVLVFTDDDLTFDPNWLDAYARRFAECPEMVAAGGHVLPYYESPPPQWLLEYMQAMYQRVKSRMFPILALLEFCDHFARHGGVFFGCNMAFRRSVFEFAGFHPELFGTRTIGDGESGLQRDLEQSGASIGYVPEAIAYHHIPRSRMTVAYICNWAWHDGGARMYAKWWKRDRKLLSMAWDAIQIVRRYRRRWLRYWRVRGRTDAVSLNTQFQSSRGLCELAYLWWMLTDAEVKHWLDAEHCIPLATPAGESGGGELRIQ